MRGRVKSARYLGKIALFLERFFCKVLTSNNIDCGTGLTMIVAKQYGRCRGAQGVFRCSLLLTGIPMCISALQR